MFNSILEKFNIASLDIVDSIADRLGLSSIAVSIGATISQGLEKVPEEITTAAVQVPWAATDYALLISGIGGVLFIIEKLIVIYIRIREATKIKRQQRKARKLPK